MKSDHPLTERQRQLLLLTEQNEYSSTVFDGLDVDHESEYVLRALVYLASRNGWKDVPEEIAVRLKGMMRCYHLQFQCAFYHIGRLIDIWNDHKIRFFVLRNAALILGGYAKDLVPIRYFCVYMRKQDWNEAYDLSLREGFSPWKKRPGMLIRDTSIVCPVINEAAFYGEAPEEILERALVIPVRYQHHGTIDVPTPAPEDLARLFNAQIMESYRRTSDQNELFYGMWLDAIIRKKAGE